MKRCRALKQNKLRALLVDEWIDLSISINFGLTIQKTFTKDVSYAFSRPLMQFSVIFFVFILKKLAFDSFHTLFQWEIGVGLL